MVFFPGRSTPAVFPFFLILAVPGKDKMNDNKKRKQQARLIRNFRKIHRWTGISLFAFFFIVSVSALLLGWKKNSGGIILPETMKGTSTNLEQWLPLDSLYSIADRTIRDTLKTDEAQEVDRIDIRKEDGIVKFDFKTNYLGLQLDGATGEVLQFGTRRSDLIEDIHDGSVLDDLFGTNGGWKLFYTTIMSVALFIFTATGFWLWYGPKRMKKGKKE